MRASASALAYSFRCFAFAAMRNHDATPDCFLLPLPSLNTRVQGERSSKTEDTKTNDLRRSAHRGV